MISLMLPSVRFPFDYGPARSRKAALPASYAKLLIADRETKNAVAGIAFLCVTVLVIAHSANPAPTPEKKREAELSADASAPSPARWLPARPLYQGAWSTVRTASPLAAHAAPSPAPSRARPFFYQGSVNDRERALDCLAAAAWYEAGNDPEGQRSVIQVVLNRVRHPSFPSSVCGVVFQGSERSTGCQFTFTCDGSMQRRFPSTRQWKLARDSAREALEGTVDTSVGQATHYHADYVVPWWSSALQQVSQIGAHIFYRWPGGRGQLVGKHNWGKEPELAMAAGIEGARSSPASASDPTGLVSAATQPASDPALSPASGRAHLIAVDPRSPSGRWAVTALDNCAGRISCAVIAYGDASEVGRNAGLEPTRMNRPLFLFVRDSASGMDLALWDCDRVSRPQASQCLPKDGEALARLMRNR